MYWKKCTLSNEFDFITVKAKGTGSLMLQIVIGKEKYRGSNYMGYEWAKTLNIWGLKKMPWLCFLNLKIKND